MTSKRAVSWKREMRIRLQILVAKMELEEVGSGLVFSEPLQIELENLARDVRGRKPPTVLPPVN